jgi:hypothetical protein
MASYADKVRNGLGIVTQAVSNVVSSTSETEITFNISDGVSLSQFVKITMSLGIQLECKSGGVDIYGVYGDDTNITLKAAVEREMTNGNTNKIQFFLKDPTHEFEERYIRLIPKYGPLSSQYSAWSVGSETKLKALCSAYKNESDSESSRRESGSSSLYFVDEANSMPFDWYDPDIKNPIRKQFRRYWNCNRKFLEHNPSLVAKLDEYVNSEKLTSAGISIYRALKEIDPKDEFIQLVWIRGMYTKSELLELTSSMTYYLTK